MSNVLSAFCGFQMLVLSRNIRHNFAALSSSLLRALGRQDQPSKYSAAVGCSAAHHLRCIGIHEHVALLRPITTIGPQIFIEISLSPLIEISKESCA